MRLVPSLVALNAAVLAGAVAAAAGVAPPPSPVAAAPVVRDDARAAVELPDPTAVAEPVVVPTPPPAPAAVPPPVATPSPPPPPPPVRRAVTRTGWAPYATVGPVTLHFPVDVVEAVGLHESGNDGALPQSPVEGADARIGLLGSRSRGTSPQGAADIVVDPAQEVRAPVTGRVVRAGSYTLYCDNTDDVVVIEPDARPGWEVKMLHFEGVRVRPGDRVVAGRTVVGARARVLPFASQVDKHTVAPHWPHLHVEVVDPSIPDRPSSGGGC